MIGETVSHYRIVEKIGLAVAQRRTR